MRNVLFTMLAMWPCFKSTSYCIDLAQYVILCLVYVAHKISMCSVFVGQGRKTAGTPRVWTPIRCAGCMQMKVSLSSCCVTNNNHVCLSLSALSLAQLFIFYLYRRVGNRICTHLLLSAWLFFFPFALLSSSHEGRRLNRNKQQTNLGHSWEIGRRQFHAPLAPHPSRLVGRRRKEERDGTDGWWWWDDTLEWRLDVIRIFTLENSHAWTHFRKRKELTVHTTLRSL